MISTLTARSIIIDAFSSNDRRIQPSHRTGTPHKITVAENIIDTLAVNGFLSAEKFGTCDGRPRRAVSDTAIQAVFENCIAAIELAFIEYDEMHPGAFHMGLSGHKVLAEQVARKFIDDGYLCRYPAHKPAASAVMA